MRFVAACLIGIVATAPSFAADGPSFDCSKARTVVDRAICSNPELSRLDRRLAEIFRLAIETQSNPRPLTADEQRWVAERSQCGQLPPSEVNSCVSEMFLTRIQDLATIAGVQPKQFLATMNARERQNPNPAISPAATPTPRVIAADQAKTASLPNVEPRPSYQPAPTENVKVAIATPVDRKAILVSAVTKGREVYAAGANDMAKGAARPGRAREICAAMPSPIVENWAGIVQTLSSNGDGLGVMSIKIEGDIALKTWNNSLSDIRDHTLIDPSSNVFRKATNLKVGQKVIFSGTFIPDTTDCFREGSMTLAGSLQNPEFIFRFSDISPAE